MLSDDCHAAELAPAFLRTNQRQEREREGEGGEANERKKVDIG